MHYRNERRGFPASSKKGAANGSAGAAPSLGPEKSVGFPKSIGATQPRSRSLGVREVKTCIDKKGL